jgi:hypothetical protein
LGLENLLVGKVAGASSDVGVRRAVIAHQRNATSTDTVGHRGSSQGAKDSDREQGAAKHCKSPFLLYRGPLPRRRDKEIFIRVLGLVL